MAFDEDKQYEVYYSGRVQGVGFRYTVRAIAKNYRVTGFVRNLSDGRVHLVVEGRTDETRKFLDAIRTEMADYIRDTQISIQPATGGFKDFDVRF